jgi:uncharacterized OsmC-like protein
MITMSEAPRAHIRKRATRPSDDGRPKPFAPEHRVNGLDLGVLGRTIAAIEQDPECALCTFRACNSWTGGSQSHTCLDDFYAGKEEQQHSRIFELYCDEPPMLAGSDLAPNPVEHLLNALAGCMTTALVAHAAVRGIEIRSLESMVEGDVDLRGFLGLTPGVPKGCTAIRITFTIDTDDDNLNTLEELLRYSPVFSTIVNGTAFTIGLQGK